MFVGNPFLGIINYNIMDIGYCEAGWNFACGLAFFLYFIANICRIANIICENITIGFLELKARFYLKS